MWFNKKASAPAVVPVAFVEKNKKTICIVAGLVVILLLKYLVKFVLRLITGSAKRNNKPTPVSSAESEMSTTTDRLDS